MANTIRCRRVLTSSIPPTLGHLPEVSEERPTITRSGHGQGKIGSGYKARLFFKNLPGNPAVVPG